MESARSWHWRVKRWSLDSRMQHRPWLSPGWPMQATASSSCSIPSGCATTPPIFPFLLMPMPEPTPAVSEWDLSRFGDLIRARTGMALSASGRANLESAVRRSMAQANADGAGTLVELLSGQERTSVAFEALISALNLGE